MKKYEIELEKERWEELNKLLTTSEELKKIKDPIIREILYEMWHFFSLPILELKKKK